MARRGEPRARRRSANCRPASSESYEAPVGVGVIGCGNISSAYLTAARKFPILDIVALADANPAAAEARAAEFGVPGAFGRRAARRPGGRDHPQPHGAEGACRSRAEGDRRGQARPLGKAARRHRRRGAQAGRSRGARSGLRLGCAPDTFLGGAHQTARRCVDEGLIGRRSAAPRSSCAPATSAGIPIRASTTTPAAARCSTWGPTMSPTSSICSARWRASAASPRARRSERLITSEPLAGARIPVEVATHVAGTLTFVSGAAVTMTMSFDVAAAQARSDRALWRDGLAASFPTPTVSAARSNSRPPARTGARSRPDAPYADGNYRILGLADMAHAIRSGRPHRASGELALHVLEVMEAFQTSSDTRRAVAISTRAGAAGAVAGHAQRRRTRLND